MNFNNQKFCPLLPIILLTVWLSSCVAKVEAVFEITNSTNQTIQRLTIQPDANKNNHINIKPNSKLTLKTDMTKLPKIDGSYYLKYTYNDTAREMNFGYYSNGYPVESITKINIQPDTIIIQPQYMKNY